MAWWWAVTGAPSADEPAREPTPIVELSWSAPAGCPDHAEVLAAIVELVGRPLGEDPQRIVAVHGDLVASDDGFSLALRITSGGETSTRTFEAARCDELLQPASVVVALAVDPIGTDAVRVPEAPAVIPRPAVRPPGTSAVPVEPIAPTTIAVAEPKHRRRLQAVLGARGGVDGGIFPGVGGMIEGSLALAVDRGRIEIVGLHVFARSRRGRGDGRGEFAASAVRPQGCWVPRFGRGERIGVPMCVGVELGLATARGRDVRAAELHRELWLAFVAGAGARWWPVPRFGIGLGADLVVNPLRRQFLLADRQLFTTRGVGARLLAAVEVRLP